MTTPDTELVDDSYPASWRPRERIEIDQAAQPLEIELAVAAMDPRERAAMLRRIERMR